MSDLSAIQARITCAQDELTRAQRELSAHQAAAAEAAKPKPWPQLDDEVFIVWSDIRPAQGQEYNRGHYELLINGLVFRTLAEAQRAYDRRQVTQKLRDLATAAGREGGKFINGANNIELYYEHQSSAWLTNIWSRCEAPNAVYFPSTQSAGDAVEVLGTELDVLRSA